jgi:hypothetical protein
MFVSLSKEKNMTAKEYREKNQITNADFWDGNEIDFNMVYEFAEDYHKEQLHLHSVSQQRELLATFYEHLNDIDEPLRHGDAYKEVDSFLAANCG